MKDTSRMKDNTYIGLDLGGTKLLVRLAVRAR